MNLAAIALLAQLAHPCSDLSAGNPTLYRPDGGVMKCLDWNQATCSYVERPCRAGELSVVCFYFPSTCRYLAPRMPVIPPRLRMRPRVRILEMRQERP